MIRTTLLVLIFGGTYFLCDRNDRNLGVYIFADSPSKCCKNPQNYLKIKESRFKNNIFRGYKFSRNLAKTAKSAKINTIKVNGPG